MASPAAVSAAISPFGSAPIPTNAHSNLGVLKPSMAGATVGADGGEFTANFLAAGDAALANARFGPTTGNAASDPGMLEMVASTQSVLPAEMARRTRIKHTGFSVLNAQQMRRIETPILAKPYRPVAWDRQYEVNMPLFSLQDDSHERDSRGLYELASLPVLNAKLHAAAALNAQAPPSRQARPSALAFFNNYGAAGAALDADAFARQWAYLGVIGDTPGPSGRQTRGGRTMMPGRSYGGSFTQLAFIRYGPLTVQNYFGTHVRQGDRLFLCARQVSVDALPGLVAPDGTTVAAHAARTGNRALQVMGSTGGELDYVPEASGCTSTADLHGPVDGFVGVSLLNERTDSLHAVLEHRAATSFTDYDFSDDRELGAAFTVRRNVAAQEGRQEALASQGEVRYRALMRGDTAEVGIVWKRPRDAMPNESVLLAAHRNHGDAQRLGTLEVHAG